MVQSAKVMFKGNTRLGAVYQHFTEIGCLERMTVGGGRQKQSALIKPAGMSAARYADCSKIQPNIIGG